MKEKKRIRKKVYLLLIVLIVSIFLSSSIYALGITPGRTTFEFEPGIEKEIVFSVVNTEHKDMNISIRIEGEWSDLIMLNQTSIGFNEDEYMKSLSYRIKFPSDISEEGIKARIIASEKASDNAGGTDIGVNIAIEHQIYILTNKSMLEEKNINVTKVFVEHYQKGGSAKFEIEVMNPSAQIMENVHSTMLIFDRNGLLRSQFNSTSINIEPDSSEIIDAYWDTYGFSEGDYGGNLSIYYDNKTEEQNLIIYLRADRIEIDFGKFEFEKKAPFSEPIIDIEEKLGPEMIVLIGAIILFIILDIIIFVRLRKKIKKSAKKNKK